MKSPAYPFDFRRPIRPPLPDEDQLRSERFLRELELLRQSVPAAVGTTPDELRRVVSDLPAPRVHVDAPDLSEIVQAVVSLKPGASAEDIASAVQRVIVPPGPPDNSELIATLAAIKDALGLLDFRMQAPQNHVAGPGSVAIRYTQAGDLKVNTDGSINVGSMPAVSISNERLTATLQNGAETSVSTAAKIWTAASVTALFIQNTGSTNNVRIGASGVTATTGLKLLPGGSQVFTDPIPSGGDIYAVAETGSSTVLAQAMT